MPRTVAIGVQDFSKLIENNSFYVDKTDFIKEWWENRDDITLITRPRRFGKTLTMSMIDYFFSIRHAGRSDLFEGLKIWKDQDYRNLQGTYPVIFLSFANLKAAHYEELCQDVRGFAAREYRRHVYLLKSDSFLPTDQEHFYKRLSGEGSINDICSSINLLSEYLYEYYGKKVIILLDEYDTPMQEAYMNGYWDQAVLFMRKFLNETFKTNPYLERGLMTGITRVSKESIFSDFNNAAVITTTTAVYETAFGFTETEVFQALEEYGLQGKAGDVTRWYDGFRFGNCDHIYNPWSMINYLKYKKIEPYWANTSSNALVGKLMQESDREIKMKAEDLLKGKSVRVTLDEQIVFDQLEKNPDTLWSLLLAGGYLKIADFHAAGNYLDEELTEYELRLTNTEVVLVFRKMIHGWFAVYKLSYHDFIKAMLDDDVRNMNVYMNKITLQMVSFFDTGNHSSKESEPERFYHGLVLGLMVDLNDRYEITSNRESGFGRYDVLLEPRGQKHDAIIMEFKVIDPGVEKSLKDTVQAALRQIMDKKYAAALESKCGRDRIRIYGFAFRGKEVLIDGGYLYAYDS